MQNCYNYFFVGLDDLRSEIDSNHKSSPINSLCQCVEKGPVFLSLQSALPLDGITTNFNIMRTSQSDLFQSILGKYMKNAAASVKRKEREKLTIEDIKTVIWDPTFTECVSLLNSLSDKSILLVNVDFYFKSIQQNMEWQLRILNAGIDKCDSSQTPSHTKWIDDAVQHIKDYWSLLTLSKAARVVITLKNKLGLTGDFKAIETLADQVC